MDQDTWWWCGQYVRNNSGGEIFIMQELDGDGQWGQ